MSFESNAGSKCRSHKRDAFAVAVTSVVALLVSCASTITLPYDDVEPSSVLDIRADFDRRTFALAGSVVATVTLTNTSESRIKMNPLAGLEFSTFEPAPSIRDSIEHLLDSIARDSYLWSRCGASRRRGLKVGGVALDPDSGWTTFKPGESRNYVVERRHRCPYECDVAVIPIVALMPHWSRRDEEFGAGLSSVLGDTVVLQLREGGL
jgi:hypothetical protein